MRGWNRGRISGSLIAAAALLLAQACARIEPVDGSYFTAGPMVGHVTEGEASVWVRTVPGARVRAAAEQNGRTFKASEIEDRGDGFRIARFRGLAPGAEVAAKIEARGWGGAEDVLEAKFRTFETPSATGKVRIAFGSCNKDVQYKTIPIFRALAAEAPDCAIFVGDNSYFVTRDGQMKTSGESGDWSSAETMIERHLMTRTNADGAKMFATIPSYGTWDDHDYGPNNSDRTFENKETALRVFGQVWANPGYGTAETPGCFSSFRVGPAEVFLMDDRYHKWAATEAHPDVKPEEAAIWGEAQLAWLLAGLKASTAPVKLICNGTQVLSETARGEGHFQEAKLEREKLFAFLKENKIGGVVFLSGDRHYSEAMALQREGEPDLLEFTSSPLQQGQKVEPLDNKNRTRLWGMRGNSYGLVTIDIPEDGPGTVRFEARDEENKVPIIQAYRTATTWEIEKLNYAAGN